MKHTLSYSRVNREEMCKEWYVVIECWLKCCEGMIKVGMVLGGIGMGMKSSFIEQ